MDFLRMCMMLSESAEDAPAPVGLSEFLPLVQKHSSVTGMVVAWVLPEGDVIYAEDSLKTHLDLANHYMEAHGGFINNSVDCVLDEGWARVMASRTKPFFGSPKSSLTIQMKKPGMRVKDTLFEIVNNTAYNSYYLDDSGRTAEDKANVLRMLM